MNLTIRHIVYLFVWVLLCCTYIPIAAAQQIQRIEYFIDADPGFGKADTLVFSASDSVNSTFSIPQKAWSIGTHTLYFRTLDSGGLYSPYHAHIFLVSDSTAPKAIDKVEYFIDRDTGIGATTLVSISTGDSIKQEFSRNISVFNDGHHFLHVRGYTANGLWTPWQMHTFFIDDTVEAGVIQEAEYFIDRDSGIGIGTPISITTADSFKSTFTKDISSFSDGQHYLHVRTKVSSGHWSPWQLHMFFIDDTVEAGEIQRAEYFIDKDSGVGSAIPLNIVQADSFLTSFSHDISALKDGQHYMHVRTKVSSGYWSPWQLHMFFIDDTVEAGPIQQLEYFIDKDSGVSNGIQVQISPQDSIQKQFEHSTIGLDLGLHYLHVRTKVASGFWSPWQLHLFHLSDSQARNTIHQISYSIDSSLMNYPFTDTISFALPKDTIRETFNITSDTSLNYGSHVLRIWAQQNTDFSSVWHFDTFAVIDCPMLDTAIISMTGNSCAGDTILLTQAITSLGIWPADSFDFSWKINQTVFSVNDSIWLNSTQPDTLMLNFSFQKKSEKRCKGEISRPIIFIGSYSDSLTLSICNNDSAFIHGAYRLKDSIYVFNGTSSTGCDSSSIVTLKVLPRFIDSTELNICQGDSILIHGTFRNTTGTFTFSGLSSSGCDSTFIIHLKVNNKFQFSDTFDLCENDTLFLHGNAYSKGGVFIDSLKTTTGCDSIYISHILLHPVVYDTSRVSICSGDSIRIHNVFRKSGGTYTFMGTTPYTCDSVSVYILSVYPTYQDSVNQQICQGDSIYIHGVFRTTSGIYNYVGTSASGCDSNYSVTLTVFPNYRFTDTFDLCENDTLQLHGKKYAKAGVFVDSLKTKTGCDSVFISHIQIRPHLFDTSKIRICKGDSVRIHNVFRKTSGIYTFNGTTSYSCDSISVFILDVIPSYHDTINIQICQGDSALIHNVFRNQSGSYVHSDTTHMGCDSITTVILQVNPNYLKTDSFMICRGDTLRIHGNLYWDDGIYADSFKTLKGCDSIFISVLKVNPVYFDTMAFHICDGDSVFIHGAFRKLQGSYTFKGSSIHLCDSQSVVHLAVSPVYNDTLTLTICQGDSIQVHGAFEKQPGTYVNLAKSIRGCDSTSTVILEQNPTFFKNDTFLLCQGDSVILHGQTLKTTGVYTSKFKSIRGCDSVFTSVVQVYPIFHETLNVGLCGGDSFFFDGQYRRQTGVYTGNFKSIRGCDSIVDLNLQIDSIIQMQEDVFICLGDSFFVGGAFRKTTGTYLDIYKAVAGCDSLVHRTLNFYANDTTRQTDSFCFEGDYNFYGSILTLAGTYYKSLKNLRGCDSVIELNLLRKNRAIYPLTATICFGDSTLAGFGYKKGSGFFSDTLSNIYGCDSIVQLIQTELPEISHHVFNEICKGDTLFDGIRPKFTEGLHTDTLKAANGCDSILFTHLAFLPIQTTTITDTICFNAVYNFYGLNLTNPGIYTHILTNQSGCDSTIELRLSRRDQFIPKVIPIGFATLSTDSPFASYQWYRNRTLIPGDTQRVIIVSLDGIYDVSVTNELGCIANSWDESLGNKDIQIQPIKVYPNPSSGNLNIWIPESAHIRIYSGRGELLLDEKREQGLHHWLLEDWKDGVYFVSVFKGQEMHNLRFILIK